MIWRQKTVIINGVCHGSVLGEATDFGPLTAILTYRDIRSLPSSHISPQDALICLENNMGYWRIYSGATTVALDVSSARGYIFSSSLRLLSMDKVRRLIKIQWSSEE